MNRRTFIARTSAVAASYPFVRSTLTPFVFPSEMPFKISLAEWSLHRSIYSGDIHPLDFPVVARQMFNIDAVEYVNAFFLTSDLFINELKHRADNEGVQNLLIMVDDAGRLGDADEGLRKNAVERHLPWLDAAHVLGCHSIRVNMRSDGSADEQMKLMADGLGQLGELAADRGLNVVVENHGGFSSHGDWMAGLMRMINRPNIGTLPDFGNWYPADEYGGPTPEGKAAPAYDRYKGVDEMMPFAKGVSAKSYAFDASGEETSTDFSRMLKTALKHGFSGHVGIEYEGDQLSEADGIIATKKLLEKVRHELAEG